MHIRLTWYGHATTVVEDVARVLTDPVLTRSLVFLKCVGMYIRFYC